MESNGSCLRSHCTLGAQCQPSLLSLLAGSRRWQMHAHRGVFWVILHPQEQHAFLLPWLQTGRLGQAVPFLGKRLAAC